MMNQIRFDMSEDAVADGDGVPTADEIRNSYLSAAAEARRQDNEPAAQMYERLAAEIKTA
jgi:hypothetical protein